MARAFLTTSSISSRVALACVHATDAIGFGREQEYSIVNIVVLILKEIPSLQTVLAVNFYILFWNNN
jgi:hypothetical protein